MAIGLGEVVDVREAAGEAGVVAGEGAASVAAEDAWDWLAFPAGALAPGDAKPGRTAVVAAHDVANTASGRWFRPGSPTYPEDPHLALAHDNYQPALAAFSVGTSIPSLPTGVYTFTPASTGRVNLDFQYVTTIGETECYSTSRNQRVLLQLVSASRLRVEGIGPGACGDPATWVLGAGAVEFER